MVVVSAHWHLAYTFTVSAVSKADCCTSHISTNNLENGVLLTL